MRKTSQWRAQRQQARTRRHETKRRAKHNTYRPRTTGVLSKRYQPHVTLTNSALGWLGSIPLIDVRTSRIRQKKAA